MPARRRLTHDQFYLEQQLGQSAAKKERLVRTKSSNRLAQCHLHFIYLFPSTTSFVEPQEATPPFCELFVYLLCNCHLLILCCCCRISLSECFKILSVSSWANMIDTSFAMHKSWSRKRVRMANCIANNSTPETPTSSHTKYRCPKGIRLFHRHFQVRFVSSLVALIAFWTIILDW